MKLLLIILTMALSVLGQSRPVGAIPWTRTALATSWCPLNPLDPDMPAPGYTLAVAQLFLPGIPGVVHHVECIHFSAQANVLGGGTNTALQTPTSVVDAHANVRLVIGPFYTLGAAAASPSPNTVPQGISYEIIRWFTSFPATPAGVARQFQDETVCPVNGWEGHPGEAVFFGYSVPIANVMETVYVSGYDH